MKILIGVPAMETVTTDFCQSLVSMRHPEISYAFAKSSLIYDARNQIVLMALENNFDMVLWIDSDMKFPPDTLIRMMKHFEDGKDYVSALAFTRKQPIRTVAYKELDVIKDEGTPQTYAKEVKEYGDEMMEIAGSGFGCVMTSVKMLKDVAEKFGPPFYPRMGFGEDLTFCWLAKNAGYKMWLDPTIKVGHMGFYEFNEETYEHGLQELSEEE